MISNEQRRKELMGMLRAKLARLLCANDVSEGEKLFRIKAAQEIIENGDK